MPWSIAPKSAARADLPRYRYADNFSGWPDHSDGIASPLSDIVVTFWEGYMQPTGESTIQVKRRIIIVLIILSLFSGFEAFINIPGSPQFQDIRSLDVVRLIAIGACWGVAVAGLGMLIGARFRKG
jgi:hypothetical protein